MDILRTILKYIFDRTATGVVFFVTIFSLCLTNSSSAALYFADKTVEAGLFYPLSPSFGLSWGDFDQDGKIDLYIKNHNVNLPSLYLNSGNSIFEDITDQAGLNIYDDFHGACWGDFDNDGDLDLYQTVGASGGHGIKANYFFQNNGDSLFTDIAEFAGIQDPLGRGRTPVWFDYNNDGRLDLFIANQMRYDAFSILYRNNGDETFTDVTTSAGLSGIVLAEGAYVADLNGDGFVELLLSSLAGILLYANNGDGTFTNMTTAAGLSGVTMVNDLALGDYDKDGDMDIFVARGPAESSDTYEADSDTMYYRLTLKDLEKGFSVDVNDLSTAEFDLYVYEQKVPTESVFIGFEKYNPLSIPFSLDAESPENHGEPIRADSG
ncbi:MAG: VCBS repeat-containing protein, partial [Desulfobacteraceae bacterium]|nr:VCBS repeat-containing protein [Desulfobacteraceae bacterium]